MEKQKQSDDFLDLEWFDEYQDINFYGNPCIEGFFQYRDSDIFTQGTHQKSPKSHKDTLKDDNFVDSPLLKQQMNTCIQQESSEHQPMKRKLSQTNVQKLSQTNRQKATNDPKSDKQGLYSKVYRQRKKQKYKYLQEQNEYLKKRIKELESQLRQQEIQLNRFKFPPPEKELSVEELNRELIEVSTNLLEDLKSKPTEYARKQFPAGHNLHQFFLQSYAQRGFAGKKKIKLLNFHFNQLLQSLLKDSEKYLCLVYANSKNPQKIFPLVQFQPINNAFKEVFSLEEGIGNRFKIFNKFLQPISLQLNKHISQLYKKFEDILQCNNKIHNFIKDTYPNGNMDLATKRLQMEKWFDFYKYGKMMRKLRYQWFQWMKKLAQKEEEETKGGKKGTKKKKVSEQH